MAVIFAFLDTTGFNKNSEKILSDAKISWKTKKALSYEHYGIINNQELLKINL